MEAFLFTHHLQHIAGLFPAPALNPLTYKSDIMFFKKIRAFDLLLSLKKHF